MDMPTIAAPNGAHTEEVAVNWLANIMAALSNATRLRILLALKSGEMSVNILCAAVGATQSHVSHELRTLRDLQLVQRRRQGNQSFYRLDESVAALLTQATELAERLKR